MGTPETITLDGLAESLKKVLRRGLPADLAAAGLLPHLRSVGARAIHPEDPVSRLDAMNDHLARLIRSLTDDRLGKVAPVLFGLASGTTRTTLTSRRGKAAAVLGYEEHHFRKRIEPEVVKLVADALYRDLLCYKGRTKRATDGSDAPGPAPTISEDQITAEEELISRIWQHVYELRAELIATARLQAEPGYGEQAERHRLAAAVATETLRDLVERYSSTYGPLLRHGELEYNANALERLANWRMPDQD